ncbi:MAG: 2,3-bisphosphoglycerate-independent phosphoglycerate mutase [Desulfobacterales bacterium]|jgi:2,3-bisphosphoglycerate-independent phosphoglycerate mutase
MNKPKPCLLMILDGWGIGSAGEGNAVHLARTPFLDDLVTRYPNTRLQCAGPAVGLPEGIMGNSEVGHVNIGAGRIVYQDLLRIDRAIADGSFFRNEILTTVMSTVRERGSALHLLGLVSDGGVHSQLDHLLALVDMADQKGLERVFVHAILDGRDTPPDSGVGYLTRLQEHLDAGACGKIATVCGRYYAMDRDSRWERVEKAYRLYVQGKGRAVLDPIAAVTDSYLREETDEFVKPMVVTDENDAPLTMVAEGDGVIFFNFRADRAREITRAFTVPDFDGFRREVVRNLCGYVCMTLYDEKLTLPVAYPPVHLTGLLGEVISLNGLRQLRIAETEKYAHVTYFFNGGEEKPFRFEDRCLIPSPREVATYDLKPEMSAAEVTAALIERLTSNRYDLIVLNFANMDMVGHTGVLGAAVKACETVDRCVRQIVERVAGMGGVTMITADHGNSEKMIDERGGAHTAHTLNPVPFILVDDSRRGVDLRPGVLADIAPTILDIMGIEKPPEMTGTSLLGRTQK